MASLRHSRMSMYLAEVVTNNDAPAQYTLKRPTGPFGSDHVATNRETKEGARNRTSALPEWNIGHSRGEGPAQRLD